MALRPSTSVRECADVYSSVARTTVRSFATRVLVVPAEKPSLMRSAVTVVGPCCSLLYHAVRSRRLVAIRALGQKLAATLKSRTTVTRMTRRVRNALSWLRSVACAARRHSRINSVGSRTYDVARYVGRHCAADLTSAASNVTGLASAKMRTVSLVSSLAASRRRPAGILTLRTFAMHPTLAKKRSRAIAKYISLVPARRRSRR